MAQIVGGIGVPHTPTFPTTVSRQDPTSQTSRYFQQIEQQLDLMRPDVLVIFDSDHLNTFFLDNMPTLSIGVAPSTAGPNDGTPGLTSIRLQISEGLASHLRNVCIDADFDVGIAQEFTVDHSILVPLHYLRPANDVPIVPVFINGLVPPLATARRCWSLGKAIRGAVQQWPEPLRVVILASGSFSLEVGGPKVRPNAVFGVPAPEWTERVSAWLAEGETEQLLAAATRDQLAAAGNVAGELLNWVAMLAAIDATQPSLLLEQSEFGHAYAAWRTEKEA